MTDNSHAPGMDPTTRAFLDQLIASGVPPIEQQSVEQARRASIALQHVPIPIRPAEIVDCLLPVGPSNQVRVRIVRPIDHRGTLPAVIFFHGGGWVLNDADAYKHLLPEIAHSAEVAVIFIEYSRSPEVRYPVAIEECYAATKWVAENCHELGVDGSRLAVKGDSAGGNICAAVTLLAQERRAPQITYQVLLYPVTDAGLDTGSYREFAAGPFLTLPAMQWFWDHYLTDTTKRSQSTVSPLRAPRELLSTLPPTLVLTAEFDVLRDDGEFFARHLIDAGVACTAIRYMGTIHGFISLHALIGTPTARYALAQINHSLRSALAK